MKAYSRRVVAAIDVGSGAIRMDIAELRHDGEVRVIDSFYRAVSLGSDVFTTGSISPETTAACVQILRDFRQKVEENTNGSALPVIRAVGTSALREAQNRDTFIDRVFIATGIALEAIEESEVHRLTYTALHRLLGDEPFMHRGDVLVAEVGGGGTKLLLIQDGFVTCSETYRLGSLRVREALETDEESDAHTEEALTRQIGRTLDQIRKTVPVKRVPRLVAVVGDLPAALFGALRPAGSPDSDRQFDYAVDVKDFEKARSIASLSQNRLMRDYSLSSQEAAAAGPALMAYLSLAKAFRVKKVTLARIDLRLGLLFDEVSLGAWSPHFTEQVLRSALALGEKYNFDRAHALHVTDLALRIFRELASDFRLEAKHEVLLRTAGILHDIGAFVSSRSHHKHSAYLIASSELFGLTTKETALIAVIARYHRRSPPAPAHPEFSRLDRTQRALVLQLAAILRVADALDRSHSQRIRIAGFIKSADELSLGVEDVGDLSLERVALETKGDLFETVFGLRVTLRATVMPGIR